MENPNQDTPTTDAAAEADQTPTVTPMQAASEAGELVHAYVVYSPTGLAVYNQEQYDEFVVPAQNNGYDVLNMTFAKRTFDTVA